MMSDRSKFHFSYIRDSDRFKATFDEKGWSKKTKKCEKKEEPGFPSYYVVHRYEYKGEDGHTKGRLLVSDLPPTEHERREQRRKKKFDRWKKEQKLIKHQENNDNGEKENNRTERARNIEAENRKEPVNVANMNREQKDDGHTSEIELEERARNYVVEIINNSLILLQCDVKGNENHKLAELTTEATVHDLSAEQKQEEKTKNINIEDHLEGKKQEVEHFKHETNQELREMAQTFVNEIIHNSMLSLQGKNEKTEHPMPSASLSEAITPEHKGADKEGSSSVPSPQYTTLKANRDKDKSNATEIKHRDMVPVRGYINDINEKSLASLKCNEHEESEYAPIMVPRQTPERNVKEKNIRDILGTEESRVPESDHDRCNIETHEKDLRDTARNLVDHVINTSLTVLKCKEKEVQQPKSLVFLSESKVRENKEKGKAVDILPHNRTEQEGAITPEHKGKDKERSNNVPSLRGCTILEAGRGKDEANTTDIEDMVRGYINDIIEKSLALLSYNEQGGKYAQSMVPVQAPQRKVETHETELLDTVRLLDEIIDTSLALLKCEDQSVQQPESLVFLFESKVRENKEKGKAGDILDPQNCSEQEAEHSQLETNIPELEHSDIARRLIDDIIRNSLGSLKCEKQEQEIKEKAKTDSIQDLMKYSKQEVELPQSVNEFKETPIPEECKGFEAKSLLLLVQKSHTTPARLSSELLDMEDFGKEMSQQFAEMMTRDVQAVRVDIASAVDTTSSDATASSNDTASISLDNIDTEMEQHCSQYASVKERKESKMRRMLRRVRKGIRCLCCCLKQ